MPTAKPPVPIATDPFRPTLARLTGCVVAVSQFLALLSSMTPTQLSHFSAGDWGRLVLAVVVAMRLSFPLPECPEYDSAWARGQLNFAAFLECITAGDAGTGTDLTAVAKRADVVSASRVVMAVVKEKYEKRLAFLQQQEQQQEQQEMPRPKCPMLDGSLDSYFPLWDGRGGQPMSMPPLSFVEGMVEGDELLDAWGDEALDWIDEDML